MSDQLVLPYPPSANRYWRHAKGHVYISKEALAYRDQIGWHCRMLGLQPLQGSMALEIQVYRPRAAGDLDNTLKVMLDALQGYLYENDKQVAEIKINRRDDKRNPRVIVGYRVIEKVGFSMDFSAYQEQAKKTAIYPHNTPEQGITYVTLGLTGEAGEVANQVKKFLRDDNEKMSQERFDKIVDEAGDTLWYLAALCDELDFSLEEVARLNLAKLQKRSANNSLHGDQRLQETAETTPYNSDIDDNDRRFDHE